MATTTALCLTKERVRQLAELMLVDDWGALGDEEIEQLLAAEEQVQSLLSRAWRFFPSAIREQQRYRSRKKEFSALSTDELQRMSKDISRERSRVLRTVPDEDLPDSFFESAPVDSDDHIICELLEERKG